MSEDVRAAATALLQDKGGHPSPHYQAYVRFQQEYAHHRAALDAAQASAAADPLKLQQWPLTGTPYQEAVDAAWDRWVGLGHKTEIERALALLGT